MKCYPSVRKDKKVLPGDILYRRGEFRRFFLQREMHYKQRVSTTIAVELANNPRLRKRERDEFLDMADI
jgi:hypothetical protein